MCVLWGIRVIVPQKLRQALDMLPEGHPGIMRMKSLARSYIWCPGLDQDLLQLSKECTSCQQVQKAPAAAPLHPWLWPEKPGALGFCRSINGAHFPSRSGCPFKVA